MDNWINSGYVITTFGEYGQWHKVEYDWGKSVLTKYFNTYQKALDFVGRYKKKMRLVNRERYPK